MIDIISSHNSQDIGVFDTQTARAANLLSIQLGSLEYAQDIGVDLEYFLDESFQFHNESFRAYLVQRLAESGVNVSSVMETIEALYTRFTFSVENTNQSGGLIAR